MKGAHGPRPAGHEHVHCHFCRADGVHVVRPIPARPDLEGQVLYALHTEKGTAFTCMKSRGQIVPDQHRHQGDPT